MEILKECLRALHENWESTNMGQIDYFQAHLLHIEYSIAIHRIFTSRFIDSLAVLMKDENVKQHVSQHNGKKIINLGINEEHIHMEKYLCSCGFLHAASSRYQKEGINVEEIF